MILFKILFFILLFFINRKIIIQKQSQKLKKFLDL